MFSVSFVDLSVRRRQALENEQNRKKLYDKRETIKERDIKRDMDKGADY